MKKRSFIAKLIKAFDKMKDRENELPKEFRFLLDDEIKQKLLEVQDNEEKIFAAADLLGESIGDENVDDAKIEELISYLKQEGIIEEKEGEEGEEGETAPIKEDGEGDPQEGEGGQGKPFAEAPSDSSPEEKMQAEQEGEVQEGEEREEGANAVTTEDPVQAPEEQASVPPGDLGKPPQVGGNQVSEEGRISGKEPETGVSLAEGTPQDASNNYGEQPVDDPKEKVIRRAVKAFESLLREE